jgi:3',5'-cyclic-AMP phosphodiesterase
MKIAFITDLHIDNEGILILDLDTRQQFKQVLDQVKNSDYDMIILGGDLCNTVGEEEIYHWIQKQLDDLNIPVLAISGNHDDSTMLANHLHLEHHLKSGSLYYKNILEGFEAIFLDSSTGELGADQWSYLEEYCQIPSKQLLIFMHHPPLICDVIAMEPKYQFKETDKFKSLQQRYSDKYFHIFTGHFHTERTMSYQNATINITPSTYVQIDPGQASFTPVFGKIGYREIILKPTEEIISFVRHL